MSFFLLSKHPLSLLMTLRQVGPALIWLGVVRADRPVWRGLVTIGRVPMFFYLVHVPVIHAIAFGLSLAWSATPRGLLRSPSIGRPDGCRPLGLGIVARRLPVDDRGARSALSGVPVVWQSQIRTRSRVLSYL